MNDSLIDLIADYISENYTFINSDGERYKDDGYTKAQYFLDDFLHPKIEKYIEENYDTVEPSSEEFGESF